MKQVGEHFGDIDQIEKEKKPPKDIPENHPSLQTPVCLLEDSQAQQVYSSLKVVFQQVVVEMMTVMEAFVQLMSVSKRSVNMVAECAVARVELCA